VIHDRGLGTAKRKKIRAHAFSDTTNLPKHRRGKHFPPKDSKSPLKKLFHRPVIGGTARCTGLVYGVTSQEHEGWCAGQVHGGWRHVCIPRRKKMEARRNSSSHPERGKTELLRGSALTTKKEEDEKRESFGFEFA